MQINIITLFPEIFNAMRYGVIGRAVSNKIASFNFFNPRDFTTDKHRSVDDHPYGGGPGMLMKVQPLQDAIHAAKQKAKHNTPVIYVSPQGKPFNQTAALKMTKQESMIFVSGRYEGIDERLIKAEITEEWSIGDYVLSGGEFAVIVMLDAIIRLLPGVLGNERSVHEESFIHGLLDFPHYTRPEIVSGIKTPNVLLSGNHEKIFDWRLKQSLGRTWRRRPDLLKNKKLSEHEQVLLAEFIKEESS